MHARYDITSPEYVGWRLLGFGNAEFEQRTEEQQMQDTMIRAAHALSMYADNVALTMARARGLDRFFCDDSLACLKHAYHESDAEKTARATAAQHQAFCANTANRVYRTLKRGESRASIL